MEGSLWVAAIQFSLFRLLFLLPHISFRFFHFFIICLLLSFFYHYLNPFTSSMHCLRLLSSCRLVPSALLFSAFVCRLLCSHPLFHHRHYSLSLSDPTSAWSRPQRVACSHARIPTVVAGRPSPPQARHSTPAGEPLAACTW